MSTALADGVSSAVPIDPFWATVVTVLGAVVTGFLLYRQAKKTPDEVSVVKALLERIAALEKQADERDVHDEARDREVALLHEDNARLHAELSSMWAKAQDQADQILFLKMWGATVDGPPPRPVPPWKKDG